MDFIFECDDLDGLVIMDKGYIEELNNQLLYDFDVCLDKNGKSELIYDFPEEKWSDVYDHALDRLKKFCSEGKMFVAIMDRKTYDCSLVITDDSIKADSFIKVKTGKIIVVSAGELIQCASYKGLEMNSILELDNIVKGNYSLKYDSHNRFILSQIDGEVINGNNIVNL